MIRLIFPLCILWFLSALANSVIIGILAAKNKVDEETKQRWFIWSIVGGPFFFVFAMLLWAFSFSESYQLEKQRREDEERSEQALKDIFKDDE